MTGANKSLVTFTIIGLLAGGCMTEDVAEVDGPTPGSRYVMVDGRAVHYVDAGQGDEAVVLVHGWSCNQSFWQAQVAGLSGRVRVLAVDLPGHGRSEEPGAPYSMALFAQAVAQVMDDAGVRSAVLAGHSQGTPVVRQFYRRYPERTAGLIVVDGSFRPFADPKFIARLNGPDHMKYATRLVDSMLPASMPAERRAFIRKEMLSAPQNAMVGGFVASTDPAIWKDDKITVPTLVVLAAAPWWDEDYERFGRALVPDVRWHVREGVSHFLMMDEPVWFNGLVSSFLEEIDFAAAEGTR